MFFFLMQQSTEGLHRAAERETYLSYFYMLVVFPSSLEGDLVVVRVCSLVGH